MKTELLSNQAEPLLFPTVLYDFRLSLGVSLTRTPSSQLFSPVFDPE